MERKTVVELARNVPRLKTKLDFRLIETMRATKLRSLYLALFSSVLVLAVDHKTGLVTLGFNPIVF